MATTYYTDIQKLYVAYFSRPADPAGLAYWETVVEAQGGSTTAVSASFAASAEYTAAYSNMTNAQIVTAVYTNLFGHAPDPAGATYWANLLDAKTITMSDAVTAIAGGAQGTDAVAYADKVTAASAFTAAVDTQAEMAGYTGTAANASAKTWLASVTDSASLTHALDPATLATTVATVVAIGTPFTVAGALAALDAATTARDTYVQGFDLDSDSTTVTTIADLQAAQTTAIAKVAAELNGGATGSSADLFKTTTSQTVRDALVTAQQATNAAALNADQAKVTADNASIAKVAGLSGAMTTLTATMTAEDAALKASTAAHADLLAKEASFPVVNGGTISYTFDADGDVTSIVLTTSGTDHTLVDVSASGKATLHTGVTASDYTGLTDLIASFNADTVAAANYEKAGLTVSSAQLAVNLMDVAPDSAGTVDGTHTESALIAAMVTQINATNPGTTNDLATGSTPTVAQIQTELATLAAADTAASHTGAAHDAYVAFQALVTAESAAPADTSADDFNPLVTQQTIDTAFVTADTTAITKFAKDVAAMQTASSHYSTALGLQATVDADSKVLTDKGYTVTTLDATHTAVIATASSDVYVVSDHSASINLFGLQGTDSLFVGTGYTMVQGAIGATGVVGNNAALEVFVSSDAAGDAILQVETHAFSSGTAGAATATGGEIITITLTGVDASTLHLGTDGIITTGAATTA